MAPRGPNLWVSVGTPGLTRVRVSPVRPGPVLRGFLSRLHLAQEVSLTVLLMAAGENLTARLRHQQGVFKLSRAPPVPGHGRPAVGPGLVLPTS